MKNKILFVLFFALGNLLFAPLDARAQTPQTSPSPDASPESNSVLINGYNLTSSIEFGIRGVHVNGNDNKYRSDLNYKPGFRVFDGSGVW